MFVTCAQQTSSGHSSRTVAQSTRGIADVADRVGREPAGTAERAEEVLAPLVVEPAGGVRGIHRHAADRIDLERGVETICRNHAQDVDRLGQVA